MEEVAFGFKPCGTVSNCAVLSTHIWGGTCGAYHVCIHVSVDSPVRTRIIPRGDKDGVALSDRNIELLYRIRLDISLEQWSIPKLGNNCAKVAPRPLQ